MLRYLVYPLNAVEKHPIISLMTLSANFRAACACFHHHSSINIFDQIDNILAIHHLCIIYRCDHRVIAFIFIDANVFYLWLVHIMLYYYYIYKHIDLLLVSSISFLLSNDTAKTYAGAWLCLAIIIDGNHRDCWVWHSP